MKGKKVKGRVEREVGHRINSHIRASEVRLIGDDGKMLGVMSASEALSIAQGRGLDLIEIAPNAKPPTCKIMDYGKWRYENKKKEKAAKKKQTTITIKEIQLRPRTDQHDRDVKLKHAIKFLLQGYKVKFNMRFTGREMAHQEIGIGVLNEVIELTKELAVVEAAPKKEGRHAFVILAPDPAKVKDYVKKLEAEGKMPDLDDTSDTNEVQDDVSAEVELA